MKFSDKEIVIGGVLLIIVGALLVNFFLSNPASAKFCGDGICSNNEIGSCKIDCDWCGDGSCNANECEIGCSEDCTLSQCENRKCEPEKGENCVNTPNDCKCVGGYCNTETEQCDYQSCGNGVCDSGENPINCPNDCQEQYQAEDTSDINYPIILVHGHSQTSSSSETSINTFKEFQEKFENQGYAKSEGIVLPKGLDLQPGSFGKGDKPIVLRTTYYWDAYSKYGSYVGQEDNQYISVYAQRLRTVVDEVLEATGKNKVKIVAHSMGGLVAREYINHQGGLNKVDKLVTIGTPNHGIYADIADNCESTFLWWDIGRDETSPECDDMRFDSSFLLDLNSGDETLGNVKYMTIRGRAIKGYVTIGVPDYLVCPDLNEYHDEVICVSSVPLNGAINKEVNGQEVEGPGAFHGDLIKPSEVPEVYDLVVDFLQD